MEPIAERLDLPPAYGKVKRTVPWETVREELTKARVYWLATVRRDGRPHVVPVDGVWVDDRFYYGGAPETVHRRTVDANPEVVMHIGDGLQAFIVEGRVEVTMRSPKEAEQLAAVANDKYGYGVEAKRYEAVPTLVPRLVLAWTDGLADATRFRFADR
jgi:nitroimidazol reductase NimA-like FMN-containing flavoprotein (pyridoxamine 5'-phosphate oxidase superfamily)